MKKYILLLTIIVIIPIFSLPVSAKEPADEYFSELESILPDWLSGVTEDTDRLLDSVGIRGIMAELISAVKGEGGRIASFALMLVGCVAFTSLAAAVGGKTGESVISAVGVICSTLIFGVLSEAFTDISSSLEELNRFFGSLIPISASVIAFGGGVQSAAVSAGGMYLTMHLVGSFGQQILFAIAALGLGISLLSSIGDGGVGSVARGVRSVFFWVLGIFTAVIGAGFALQTAVASAKDSMTVRAAKYMASGLVPLVGSTVSGALSTLASGLSYAKEIIGAASVIAIVGIVISPLALLLLYRLSLSLAGILSEAVGSSAGRIFDSFRFSLDMIIALYSLSALIYVFEIILFIKIGADVL